MSCRTAYHLLPRAVVPKPGPRVLEASTRERPSRAYETPTLRVHDARARAATEGGLPSIRLHGGGRAVGLARRGFRGGRRRIQGTDEGPGRAGPGDQVGRPGHRRGAHPPRGEAALSVRHAG